MNTHSSRPASTPPGLPDGVRRVGEARRSVGGLTVRVHPGWSRDFPWLLQGTTERGESGETRDYGLFGPVGAGAVLERWRALGEALGAHRVVHGRQVHGAAVRFCAEGAPGLHLSPATDGHATRSPGVILTVSTADCVPVSLVDPNRRAVALLHAGWRGVAAGILERGLDVLQGRVASRVGDLHVHFGPAICGRCYEVGPEVHGALGLAEPAEPATVGLRAVLARRALDRGVEAEQVTVSSWCTLCGDSPFFSHRGGCVERQLGLLGVAR